MAIKLNFNSRLSERDKDIYNAYWAFDGQQDYISFIYQLCHQHNVTTHDLFRAIEKCYVCLDEVGCISCGCYYPLEVPADVVYIKGRTEWVCEDCSMSGGDTATINR